MEIIATIADSLNALISRSAKASQRAESISGGWGTGLAMAGLLCGLGLCCSGSTRASGLSERTFKRRFRQATGMTPIEYVHSLRLEEAKRRLETSDEAIEHIAIDAGYEDASFFRRLFRRKVGLTPLAYRRRFGVARLPGRGDGSEARG